MSTTSEPTTFAAIVQAYIDAGNPMEATSKDIASWAVYNDLYDVPFEDKIKRCAKDLSAAMRKESITDASGNKVRKYLSAVGEHEEDGESVQRHLWDTTECCTSDFAHKAVRGMRSGIAGDCRSLNNTVMYVNEHNSNLHNNPIVVSFDFTDDI